MWRVSTAPSCPSVHHRSRHWQVAVGTLKQSAGPDALARCRRYELGGHPGHDALGTLHVDAGDGADPDSGARGLDFVVEAAWSGAEVHSRAERLAALEASTRAIAAELDIDRVLGLIVERVRDLVGARFAALGIADGRGRLERFITQRDLGGGPARRSVRRPWATGSWG